MKDGFVFLPIPLDLVQQVFEHLISGQLKWVSRKIWLQWRLISKEVSFRVNRIYLDNYTTDHVDPIVLNHIPHLINGIRITDELLESDLLVQKVIDSTTIIHLKHDFVPNLLLNNFYKIIRCNRSIRRLEMTFQFGCFLAEKSNFEFLNENKNIKHLMCQLEFFQMPEKFLHHWKEFLPNFKIEKLDIQV